MSTLIFNIFNWKKVSVRKGRLQSQWLVFSVKQITGKIIKCKNDINILIFQGPNFRLFLQSWYCFSFFSSLSFIIVCFIFVSYVYSGEYVDVISKQSGEDGMMVEAWDDVEIGRMVEAREEWETESMNMSKNVISIKILNAIVRNKISLLVLQ